MNKQKFLHALLAVPSAYLAVLLAFDLKYYDASEMAYTVPIYPTPMYLKFVLSILSCIITTVILSYFVSRQEKVNQSGSDSLIQESEVNDPAARGE